MTNEQLEIAKELERRIEKLDNEIYAIMGITPSIRSNKNHIFNWRGRLTTIEKNGKYGFNGDLDNRAFRIELSNEDCRALVDIRTAELEQLKQILEFIK